MNRKIIHISLIFMGFIVLTSKSCEPDADADRLARSKAKRENLHRELRNEFTSEYLFEDQLIAYEEKGKQKLSDFADLLNLYSDRNKDPLFKQQVEDMIYRLFYNKEVPIQLSITSPQHGGGKKCNLDCLLNRINGSKYQSLLFLISDLKTLEPMHREGIDKYTGKLGCTFDISGISKNDTLLLNKTNYQVKIITMRTSKQFGADKPLLIWQVFLAGVDAIPQGYK